MTYFLRENRVESFESFPDAWHKWKWFAKFINWLLRKTGVQAISKQLRVQRITIDEEFGRRIILRTINEERRRNHEVRALLIGRDQYYKLMTEPDALSCPIYLTAKPQFYGVDLILHPLVDGIIPLDFSRQ